VQVFTYENILMPVE